MSIDFEKIFNEGYEKVIHFTISSKLSSMNQLFNNVSRDYFDNKIIVIDSYAVSSVMLSHVLFTVDELAKGTEIEQIIEKIFVLPLPSGTREKNYIKIESVEDYPLRSFCV